MADGQYRLRVNLGAREFEIEGSKDFVEKHRDGLLQLINQVPPGAEGNAVRPPREDRQSVSGGLGTIPSTFGEYRNSFPQLSNTELLLVAAHFLQEHSDEPNFTYQGAGELLLDHDVKVNNPSQVVARLEKQKRVFKVRQGTYKVSDAGKQFIRHLTEKE